MEVASDATDALRWAFVRTTTPSVGIGGVTHTGYGTPIKDGQKDMKYPVRKQKNQRRCNVFTKG